MTDRASHPRSGAATVVAVVVADRASAYLAETLRGVAQQSRMPADIVVVDVSGAGGTRAAAPGAATFGEAVSAGLAAVPDVSATWLWLLHDDSAPDPGTLAALTRAVELAPSVVVAGCKQRQWGSPCLLYTSDA